MKEFVNSIIKTGKFFSVTVITKDNRTVKLNGRTGVIKYLKGTGKTIEKPDLQLMYDVKRIGYRFINIPGITEIRANKKIYKL